MFVGNQTTCLKILPSQIQFIVDLAALHQEKAPQFLDLLKSIVKVEGLGLTLKRNQAYVMKYIMQVRGGSCIVQVRSESCNMQVRSESCVVQVRCKSCIVQVR